MKRREVSESKLCSYTWHGTETLTNKGWGACEDGLGPTDFVTALLNIGDFLFT